MSNRFRVILTGAMISTLWITAVILSGVGWNPLGMAWNFTNTGAFGDSFGPLAALMAALAAFAAFETLSEQRAELERIKTREKQEDERHEREAFEQQERQRQNDLANRKDAFEGTFFKLLDALRDIVKDTDIGFGDSRKSSRDAFHRVCTNLVSAHQRSRDLESSWSRIIDIHKNDLNHYFRFFYHIVKFVDSQNEVDSYFYIRILRATLSEAEIILLFANCAVGEGKDKFLPLVEKYSLLHNISPDSREKWKMDDYVSDSAFTSSILNP